MTRDTHTYCRAFGSGAVTTCFYDLGLSRLGFEHPTSRLLSERSKRLRHRIFLRFTCIVISQVRVFVYLLIQWSITLSSAFHRDWEERHLWVVFSLRKKFTILENYIYIDSRRDNHPLLLKVQKTWAKECIFVILRWHWWLFHWN